MPKCPKCGKEIDYLINYCKSWEKFYFDGEDYNYIDTISTDENEYACPECDETLFYNEEDAQKFLKQRDETNMEEPVEDEPLCDRNSPPLQRSSSLP